LPQQQEESQEEAGIDLSIPSSCHFFGVVLHTDTTTNTITHTQVLKLMGNKSDEKATGNNYRCG